MYDNNKILLYYTIIIVHPPGAPCVRLVGRLPGGRRCGIVMCRAPHPRIEYEYFAPSPLVIRLLALFIAFHCFSAHLFQLVWVFVPSVFFANYLWFGLYAQERTRSRTMQYIIGILSTIIISVTTRCHAERKFSSSSLAAAPSISYTTVRLQNPLLS